MIPVNRSLTSLHPARQAALQAITRVEEDRQAGNRLPEHPYARTFLRLLTGSGRLNATNARAIPGLVWFPRNGQGTLKEVESALDELLASQGEHCPLPLPLAVAGALFPDVAFRKRTRLERQAGLKRHKACRQEDNRMAQAALQQQNLVSQARTELNFHSPDTVGAWYERWQDDLNERELSGLFTAWCSRFASLADVAWLEQAGDPLWSRLLAVRDIVAASSVRVRMAERWQVPNKLTFRREAA